MKNRKTAKCKSQNVKVALYDAYFSEKLKVKSEKFPILTLRYLRLCVKKINAEGVKKMRTTFNFPTVKTMGYTSVVAMRLLNIFIFNFKNTHHVKIGRAHV